ncbi:MAG: hypothetical protein ACO4AI_03245 [Prochlorothrix sp.]|nr:hypothetical protein [Prochlorothrix sp.]
MFTNADRLLTLLPAAQRPPLRILAIILTGVGLLIQGFASLGVWHFGLLPLVQVALIAHGVEAGLGFWLAPQYGQSRWKTAIGVFFAGTIGLADLVDHPTNADR